MSDDNIEENMEDILDSIRQIMNIEAPSSPTPSGKSSAAKKKSASFSDIPHISDKKSLHPQTLKQEVTMFLCCKNRSLTSKICHVC
ncbi:MAG: hypothetical protein H6925_01010 [Holosporaceae bacterium]|nr:MAG: hypothetical protein H6925_01010 [Holosporaceae bacterium]